jgi:hypothetical protein
MNCSPGPQLATVPATVAEAGGWAGDAGSDRLKGLVLENGRQHEPGGRLSLNDPQPQWRDAEDVG